MSEKRIRRPVSRYAECASGNQWTEAEKEVLLTGLERYGHMNIERISQILPTKSPTAIKLMTKSLMTAARRSVENMIKPPIDMWLEQSSVDDTNALISQALYFISMFEKHPDYKNCHGCDLSIGYDYIYRMMHGYPAIQLPSKTRRIIFNLISKAVSKVRSRNSDNVLQFTNNLYKSTPRKDYTRRTRIPEKIGRCKVLQRLNIFSVSSEQLQVPRYDKISLNI